MSRSLRILCQVVWIVCFLSAPLYAQRNRVLQEIGRSLEQAGEDLLRTIERYTIKIDQEPGNGAYFHERANAYFDRGEFRKAVWDYGRAIELYGYRQDDRMAHAHLHRGLSHYILGDHRRAESDFTEVINRRPDQPDAYYFRGKIYHLALKQYPQARADFEKVLRYERHPSVQSAYTHLFLDRQEEANQEIEQLLSKAGRYPRENFAILHYNIAGFRAIQNRKDEAVRHLRTALQSGYSEYDWLVRDLNFCNLSSYQPFTSLLRSYGQTYQGNGYNSGDCYPTGTPKSPTPGRPTQPANLITSQLQYEDGNGNQRLDAGETSYLTFTLRNEGTGAARNLVVSLRDEREIDGLTFEQQTSLGTLSPGDERTVRLGVNGARYLQEGQADFTIEVLESNGFDAVPLHLTVQTGAFAPPDLIVADHVFSSQQGGRFQLGVPITLKLAIQNRGRGVAQGVNVRMRLPDNVFSAGTDLFDLGEMAPGADQQLDFEFFTNRRFEEQEVSIKVIVSEGGGNYTYEETLSVGINDQLEVNDRVIITPTPTPNNDPSEIRLLSDVDRDLPQARRSNPNAIAVVIGNRDYENPDVPPVDYALQDAASMRKYLVESFGFDETNILFLTNATQADFNGTFGTKEDHRARLFNLVRANESDVFVFYSGHGAPDLSTEDAYFVPVDCDPSLVRFNGYAMKTLYDNLAKIPYRSLTVVIDACFSGATDRGTLTPQASIVRIRSKGNVLQDPKAMVFTAATGAQIASWYPDQSHGLFTYYFLKGLQGEANTNGDRTLTLAEMKAYLDQEVPYMARRMRNRDQTPETYGQPDKTLLGY